MKKIFTLLSFACFSIYYSGFSQVTKPSTVNLISDDGTTSTIRFDFGTMLQQTVITPHGNALVLSIDKGTPILRAGYPDLPKITTSLIIPDDKNMEITITGSHYTDYTNINIAPSKGTLVRTIEPSTIPYSYSADVYQDDFFFPKNLAELREPYILRDYRGVVVVAYPFQYNAATNTLRVYSDLTVKVTPSGGSASNPFLRKYPIEKIQTEFSNIYKHQFLNFGATTSRYNPLADHGSMLIICGSGLMEAMQPLVDWKNQEGIKTEIVDVAIVGNDATSIKNYVADYYNTHGLTFLLLAGDAAQVATGFVSGSGDSDNQYGYISGDDHYQEIFVGRFSATTPDDITTQVNRTIEYEKNPVIDSSYAKGVSIASNYGAGIGDDGEADYEHERNIRNQLLGYTYSDIQELFDSDHPGGNDASGDPHDYDLAALVNAGTGMINYTGHGSQTSIVTTGFDNNDVDALTNTHHFPFIWIVGCVAGDFKNATCFAEEWARHTYNGNPSGSLASFMSTINQYWAEPMEMQDEGNNILAEAESNNIRRTFGGLSINGCFSMNDAYGQSGYDMTDTWTIFGDPSVMVRTTEPSTMTVTNDPQITLGATVFTVNCDAENAVVSLTHNNIILGTAAVSSGIAVVELQNALVDADSILITVTAFNKVPYITTIPAIPPAGAFIVNTSSLINDAAGNNNGMADYGESISLDVTMENVGVATAQAVTATLSTTDPFITISDPSESFGDISGNESVTHSSAFSFNVAGNVDDGHVAYFSTAITDNANDTWTAGSTVVINAPVLSANIFAIDDGGGNNNGNLDPGESVTLTVYNSNTGHADAADAWGTLACANPYITISNSTYSLGNLVAGTNPGAPFTVTVDPNTPFGTEVAFSYSVNAGSYSGSYDFTAIVTPALEGFETGDFSSFDWQFSGNQPWETESYDVYEGTYAARSGGIMANESSTLMIILNALSADDISFMLKTSSEPNYDSLSFSIDNVSQGHWSGIGNWSAKTFPVTAGNHTFTWKYQKDNGINMGFDCAYLDNIVLPASQVADNISPIAASNGISCYPNPFSELTFIDYTLPEANHVSIAIFDLNGRRLKTILSNDLQDPGNYHLGFNASMLSGENYVCRISIGTKIYQQKLVVIR